MKIKNVFVFLVGLSITACDFVGKDLDAVKTIRGPKMMAKTQAVFDYYDIDYKVEGRKIHFSSEDKDEVEKALEKARDSKLVQAGVIKDQIQFQERLKSLDLINKIIHFDSEEYIVMWRERLEPSSYYEDKIEQQIQAIEEEYAAYSEQHAKERQKIQEMHERLAEKDKRENENNKLFNQ